MELRHSTMDRRARSALTAVMTNTTATSKHDPQPASPTFPQVQRLIQRRSFCTLATASPANRPHSAGVLYAYAESVLYVSTARQSRKAQNIAANPDVFIVIPVRRAPVGPPSSLQFSATADILDCADPEINRLAAQGSLTAITGHGELELDGGCFLRIRPRRMIHTYGIGMPLIRLIRDPLNAAGSVLVSEASPGSFSRSAGDTPVRSGPSGSLR
jgi:hypothetical protein